MARDRLIVVRTWKRDGSKNEMSFSVGLFNAIYNLPHVKVTKLRHILLTGGRIETKHATLHIRNYESTGLLNEQFDSSIVGSTSRAMLTVN